MLKSLIEKITPRFLISFYHYLLALISAFLYGFPSRKLVVIGVTGTKGKSTTVILAGKILEEAGYKVAWFTSATIKIGDKEQLNPYHMTMPGRFVIQSFLRKAVGAGCKYTILEVTSEGIKQYRHKFINFDTAVFTNLKPEHIEAHGSFEKYRYCKGKLFEATKNIHVLNMDDENVNYFLQFSAKKKYVFTMNNEQRTVSNKNLFIIHCLLFASNGLGISFKVQNTKFNLQLIGEFNIYNALAAICVGLSQNVGLENCKKALEKITTMPGRMEVVVEKPFKVIVDLAHTPDSYEEVFKAIKTMPYNKIISVFGSAGGGRDKWKRPVLGKIAAENSDIVILTNEDPYDEDPNKILSQIKSGITNKQETITKIYEILDRREAIKKALELAEENDIVLLLGKGTEQLMIVGDSKIPWDDRKIVREGFNRVKK